MSLWIPEKATSRFLKHITEREGVSLTVYLDSLGFPTVGVGHKVVLEDDLALGDRISTTMANLFLQYDSDESWQAAVDQAVELGRIEIPFIEALASVNFQLGTSWYTIHEKTWDLMMKGCWEAAAEEVADSLWYKQTPIRVEDFQKALTNGR